MFLWDKQNLNHIESSLRKMKAELDFRINELRDKENNLSDYDKVIKESENTLQRVFIIIYKMINLVKSLLKLQIN